MKFYWQKKIQEVKKKVDTLHPALQRAVKNYQKVMGQARFQSGQQENGSRARINQLQEENDHLAKARDLASQIGSAGSSILTSLTS